MIKRYVYELDVLKQKAGETAETNREKVGNLNQKILLLESENKKIRENVCVNGVYLLDQLKKEKLIVKNMTKQEKEQLLEYRDLIYGNLISRLKKDFKLTSGNLILIALLKVGFTTTELMFTFDCVMNSIFTKKRRLRESLNLDTTDKLEEFITLYWHYKIFCENVKYGIQYGVRIFYLIALQKEENYEREESCSA